MADYKEMYKKMFTSTSKAIEILKKAQLEAEELYIQSLNDEPKLIKGHIKDKNLGSIE